MVSEATAFTAADCERCRRDFPSLARTFNGRPIAYLDGPAGTQVPEPVIAAMSDYYRAANANTHGEFPVSRDTDRLLHETRVAAAAFLGAPDWRSVSFGQNMTTLTYSLSYAVTRALEPGDEIVITQLDHEANRGPWLNLPERGIVVREAALRPDGRLDLDDLARQITKRTRLVALGLASNALGTVNLEAAALARRLSKEVGAWLFLDAVHYAAHFPVDVVALDADFLLCSAYKFYGPHVGLLYTRPGLLEALRVDRLRTQEEEAPWRIETGTLNHAALVGVKAAVEYIASWGTGAALRERIVSAMAGIAAYEHGLGAYYYENVGRIPGVAVRGPDFSGPRAPTVSITLEGVRPIDAARALGERGIQVWDGHFYALRPIEALGLAERGGVLRAGIAMYNTREEIDRLLEGVEALERPTVSPAAPPPARSATE
ncbi:MAG TPA: cysteine desulfurase-like protein [Thermoanaerobaculia bacterium]|jgi:cysteine desulfurase family protein (TIGR01976 family)|nr:cysteine desulfurase-like protein [Thermoanaerobaculia bacterium]